MAREHWTGSDLPRILDKIRYGISRGAYPNETAVRTQIVQPILHGLGWDVYDPDHVCAEYPLRLKTATRRIDLALCVSNRNPRCIVELKSTEYALKQIGRSDGDRQLFEYSFHAGAPLALLTNGVNWRFYSTQSAGTYAERLVSTFDFETDSLDDIAARLERYLSYANTKSGKAADFAREDLNARLDQHKAQEAIPRAWALLVEGDLDERLATLLAEATSSLTDGKPTRRAIADFLRRLKPDGGRRQRKSHEDPATATTKTLAGRKAAHTKAVRAYESAVKRRAPRAVVDAAKARVQASASRLGTAVPIGSQPAPTPDTPAVRYWLLGEECLAKNAKEAYVAVFTAFAERDPDFLTRVGPKLRGHKNRGVARTKQELSSNESMANSGAMLPGNWWLLTKLGNRAKIQSLRTACDAAGIRFGDPAGLDISLPNT